MSTTTKCFISILSFTLCSIGWSQTTIAIQSFEQNSSDTWSPITLSTPPCTNGSDQWDYATSLLTLSPNHLNQFWGIRDLNGDCGSSGGETLYFPTMNISLYTNVSLSFDYNLFQFDTGDDLFYTLTIDGIAQNEVQIFDGYSNLSTSGWVTEAITIPNGTNSVGFQIRVVQNGGTDYGGIDNVRLEGFPSSSCLIQSSGLNNIMCNDNGTSLDFSDDYINFTLDPSGANLGSTYSISSSQGNFTPNTSLNYGSPINLTLTNGSGNNGNFIFVISDDGGQQCTFTDTLVHSGYCSNGYNLTITNVSALSYSVSCSTTDNGILTFTSTGTFSQNNNYYVELSDENGSFNPPLIIGQLSSSSTSGSINFTIPTGTPSGALYRIRLTSSQPNVTSPNNGSDISIQLDNSNCYQPFLTSLLTNSCANSDCSEGLNELIFLNSGVGFTANTNNLRITYGNNSGTPYDVDYTDILIPNASKVQDLNLAAGCAGLFIDGTNQAIPPNSTIIFAHTNLCDNALDWTGLCGQGPIYMIFNDDSEWNNTGNFINGTTNGNRYINIIVTDNTGNTSTTEYWFNTSNNSGNDGDYQNYSPQGGEAIYYGNQGCALNSATLPVEMNYFRVANKAFINTLEWETLSESNNAYFQVERRLKDQDNWEVIHTVTGAGNTSSVSKYQFLDKSYREILNYYRLKQVDFNGEFRYSQLVSVDNRSNKTIVGIYNTHGQPVNMETSGLKIIQFEDGCTLKVIGNLSNY